jgi:hypothetical protein
MSESQHLAKSLKRLCFGDQVGIFAHNSYHTAEIITVRNMQGFWMEST